MRSDGGWLRIGRNTSLTFDGEFQTIYDANLVSQDDMDVVAGHVAGLGAFTNFEVDCNVVRVLPDPHPLRHLGFEARRLHLCTACHAVCARRVFVCSMCGVRVCGRIDALRTRTC